ncbi:MAG: tRNA (N6-isopentenyl adenosine(37)-C2)-methylthiotransferase MiaB [candidate division Zixibacteria bacterium]|nr:tRNA (N6-isopentenyl adenosine(37)-C2)-methylthiotransferase MiaB [candidate division Zixibacteria bacterium]
MLNSAYILTFGCQMNQYDSEVLESILAGNGCLITDMPDSADLIVVNTCSVRQKAESRAMAHIAGLAALKKKNPLLIVIVAGCMAKRAGQEIIDKIPGVDYVVGPDYLPEIPEIIKSANNRQVYIDEKAKLPGLASRGGKRNVNAYLAITRGCENYCSYCIVPYVRGSLRSKPVDNIIAEMKMLVERGAIDITLLGQNVNSYNDNNLNFPKLLNKLAPYAPPRLRFLTSHPKDFSDELIGCFNNNINLCESLHLPLQSGSDKILKAMNRGYDTAHYLDSITKLKKAVPDITLSTDLIVGYPGETEADFQQTISIVKEIEYDSAFMFRYSVRPGTKAAELADDIPEPEKIDRLSRLIELQQKISESRNARWNNQSLEILIDSHSRRKPIMPKGKTRGGQSVLITDKPDLKTGDMIFAKVALSKAKTLFASFEKFA